MDAVTSTNHHLTHLSIWKRLYISLIGPIYAFVFRTNYQKFLGVVLSQWVKWLPFWLALIALVLRWPLFVFWLILLITVLIRLIYWIAQRNGYSRFVADPKPHPLPENVFLPMGEKVGLRATGLFAVAQREERLFLRPAEFWQVPLGERIIMVKAPNELFLYQFLSAETITKIESGWLVFGKEPLPSISITFCATWGPGFDDDIGFYYVGDGPDSPPCQNKTVILTFDDADVMAQVESNLLVGLE